MKHRSFQKNEHHRVRDLLRVCYRNIQHPYLGIDLSNWERFCAIREEGENQAQFHIWEKETNTVYSELIGIAQYQKNSNEVSCWALFNDLNLFEEMYLWANRLHKTYMAKDAKSCSLQASCSDLNIPQRIVLERLGFTKGKTTVTFRKRIMDQSVSVISPPKGFVIRNLQDAEDEVLAERISAENQVFGRDLTISFLYQLNQSPIYRPTLDLILCTSDGIVAAFCTAWFDDQNQIGYFEPIGTSSDFLRRGFAKILISEGFRLLQQIGARIVYLGHSADNIASGNLYESMGLQVFDQETQWEKENVSD